MEAGRVRGGGWRRPIALLAVALMLAVGQPLVVVAVTFGMLAFLSPGIRLGIRALAAIALGLTFAGEPQGGFWYLERGWALVVGGSFVALSLARPTSPFLFRGMVSVGMGAASVGLAGLVLGGWEQIDWLITQRVEQSVSASLQAFAILGGGEAQPGLQETLSMAGEVQNVIFPSLVALSTLAALGVAWWLHVRVGLAASEGGLGPLREFRFPDALIWAFIAGLVLLLLAEWSDGWGRVGTNVVAFMAALYLLRGAGVLLFLWGGVSWAGGLLLMVGLLLAGPVLGLAAMLVGVGDSWFDIRRRLDGPPADEE
jgi:hypothetical protein